MNPDGGEAQDISFDDSCLYALRSGRKHKRKSGGKVDVSLKSHGAQSIVRVNVMFPCGM